MFSAPIAGIAGPGAALGDRPAEDEASEGEQGQGAAGGRERPPDEQAERGRGGG